MLWIHCRCCHGKKNGKREIGTSLFFVGAFVIFSCCYIYRQHLHMGSNAKEQILATISLEYVDYFWLEGMEARQLLDISDNELLLGKDNDTRQRKETEIDHTVRMVAAGEKSFQSLEQDGILRNSHIEKKQIALTFDDGPSKNWTEKYLALLKE